MKFKYNDGGRSQAGYKGTTGDCVCRSIAIATEQPYQVVYAGLNQTAGEMRQTKRVRGSSSRTGIARAVYEKYLKNRGWAWQPLMSIGSGCRVHLKDGELPQGRLIVRLSGHMAAVIDGVLNDTHDCSRDRTRCVYGYWYKD